MVEDKRVGKELLRRLVSYFEGAESNLLFVFNEIKDEQFFDAKKQTKNNQKIIKSFEEIIRFNAKKSIG